MNRSHADSTPPSGGGCHEERFKYWAPEVLYGATIDEDEGGDGAPKEPDDMMDLTTIDIYSLGCTMFECITGTPTFRCDRRERTPSPSLFRNARSSTGIGSTFAL